MVSILKKICIFQPYLTHNDRHTISSGFVHFDHTENPDPDLREYLLFKRIYEKLDSIDAEYIGLFSQKFTKKSLLNYQDIQNHIQKTPGYDVYLFNPFPQNDYMFYNVWDQGEFGHKGIIQLTQDALNSTFPETNLLEIGRSPQKTLYCNFWVAKKSFWHEFMNYMLTIGEHMIAHREKYFSNTFYHLGDMPIFTFIIERLFTTYLMLNDCHYFPFTYPKEYFLRLIHHEFELKLYHALKPLVESFDKQYGGDWPTEAQKKLIIKRTEVCDELERLGCSTKNRY